MGMSRDWGVLGDAGRSQEARDAFTGAGDYADDERDPNCAQWPRES
jgi:hypothetical protein